MDSVVGSIAHDTNPCANSRCRPVFCQDIVRVMRDVGFESKQGRLVCGDVGCCCRHNEATKKAVQQRQQQIRTPKWRGPSSSLHEVRAAVDFVLYKRLQVKKFYEVIFSVSVVCHFHA
ncbi:hypothetical protein TB1_005043 [Malus domestica]